MLATNETDVVITMLGSLGLQVASRFVRSLRETGAHCRLVLLLPESPASTALVEALSEWRVTAHVYETTARLTALERQRPQVRSLS
jgi:hypothetical protein